MRTVNTAAQALLDRKAAGEAIPIVRLVELATPVVQRWAQCGRLVEWGGFDWEARDIGISEVEDSASGLNDLTLTLPAVTSAEISLAYSDLDGVVVRVYDAIIDPDDGQVADAPLAWQGECDVPGIQDGAEAVVILRCIHKGNAALRPKPSLYSDDEQRRLYPGDNALDFDPGLDSAGVVWPSAEFFKQG